MEVHEKCTLKRARGVGLVLSLGSSGKTTGCGNEGVVVGFPLTSYRKC